MNKGHGTAQTVIVVLALAFAIAPLAAAGQAEPRYHLITFPQVAADIGRGGPITNSGVLLAGDKVVKPARDDAGNPVWDSDGDGVADGYHTVTLPAGPYTGVGGDGINESLDVVGSGWGANGREWPLLSLNGPGGYTLVDLGSMFTTQERERFGEYQEIKALDINDLGQVLVWEYGAVYSEDPYQIASTNGLAVITPTDVDGDGKPKWFQDRNNDGANDLMEHVEFITQWALNRNCIASANNHGEVRASSSATGRHFVVHPRDVDEDGFLECCHDGDGDGLNDLATYMEPGISLGDISDSGVLVGREYAGRKENYRVRWQIDGAGNIALVAKERVRCQMCAVNDQGDAVGYQYDRGYPILWEPEGSVIDLLDLLDNPTETMESMGSTAMDINDAGTIAGLCHDGDWFWRPVLTVPLAQVPPSPGITVDPTDGLVTTEGGGTDTFTIVLGTVTFKLKNAPSGTYATEVQAVVAAGLTWDGITPENSYTKQ